MARRTSDEVYGDGSGHEICDLCGTCIECDHVGEYEYEGECPSPEKARSLREQREDLRPQGWMGWKTGVSDGSRRGPMGRTDLERYKNEE